MKIAQPVGSAIQPTIRRFTIHFYPVVISLSNNHGYIRNDRLPQNAMHFKMLNKEFGLLLTLLSDIYTATALQLPRSKTSKPLLLHVLQ